MAEKGVILVTGSCGRIGAGVVKKLGEDHRMVGFELLNAFYASPREELVPCDLSSDESVHQALMPRECKHSCHFQHQKFLQMVDQLFVQLL